MDLLEKLHIWFNRKDLISDKINHTTATDTRGYDYQYNSYGKQIIEELDHLLRGANIGNI